MRSKFIFTLSLPFPARTISIGGQINTFCILEDVKTKYVLILPSKIAETSEESSFVQKISNEDYKEQLRNLHMMTSGNFIEAKKIIMCN